MIYLSGTRTTFRHPRLGFMLTPISEKVHPPDDCVIAIDNGCFANPHKYSTVGYLRFLNRFRSARVLFATAPDVLGNHEATVSRAVPILHMIRAVGIPAAFVAQDGWHDSTTPWNDFDVLFVGGSTEFKFRCGRAAVSAAKLHGKKTHMGRVNSLERLRAAVSIGCDSVDGNFLKFGPLINIPRMVKWFDALDNQKEMQL